jgi:hypothetical protein
VGDERLGLGHFSPHTALLLISLLPFPFPFPFPPAPRTDGRTWISSCGAKVAAMRALTWMVLGPKPPREMR